MASGVSLSAGQRKKLLHYYRRHPNPTVRRRAQVLLLLAGGRSWCDIKSIVYISFGTISLWRSRFTVGGVDALLDRPAGSRSRWSEEAEAILRQALAHSPDELGYLAVNWRVPLLRQHIEQVWGQRPSDLRARGVHGRLNLVWKRPGLNLRGVRSPRVMMRLRLLRRKVRSLPPGYVKLFEDETDLLLFPPLRAG
jgi:transposase